MRKSGNVTSSVLSEGEREEKEGLLMVKDSQYRAAKMKPIPSPLIALSA